MKLTKPIIVVLSITIIVTFSAFYFYRQLRKAGMKACVYSLEKPVRAHLDTPLQPPNSDAEWKPLPAEVSRAIVRSIVESGKTDCGTFKNMLDGNDYWSNPIRIAVYYPSNGPGRVRVSSDGADGISNSDDDITVESVKTPE